MLLHAEYPHTELTPGVFSGKLHFQSRLCTSTNTELSPGLRFVFDKSNPEFKKTQPRRPSFSQPPSTITERVTPLTRQPKGRSAIPEPPRELGSSGGWLVGEYNGGMGNLTLVREPRCWYVTGFDGCTCKKLGSILGNLSM